MTQLVRFTFSALIVIVAGLVSGNDGFATPPSPPDESVPSSFQPNYGNEPDEQSELRVPGTWMKTPIELRLQAAPRVADVPASLTIDWPALDQADIDAAREETSSQALVTGLHRPMPSGHQGDLLEELQWTDSEQRRQARIQLTADGAESIRVRFRASLPAESSLTFLGTHNEDAGLAPPVWSQSELASRQADSVALWSPSGQAGELGIVVDVPADADLTGHFLVFETISHRWASVSVSAPAVEATPKHASDNALECPFHYVEAACYTSEYPSVGMVVHIHYESNGLSYLCSGATIVQRGAATQRALLLTAHHCIETGAEADSIESVHYYAASRCGGTSLDARAFRTYGGAEYLAGLHSADQTLVQLRGPFSGRNVWLSGWDASNNGPYEDAVFGLHHPKGHPMAFSKGSANQRRDIRVRDYGTVLDAIPVLYYIGTTEGGSSGSGLFYHPAEGYLVGVLSSGLGCDGPSNYGSFRDFFPVIRRHIDPGGTEQLFKVIGRGPFFPRDGLPAQQGFVFLNNASDQEATVVVHASQDTSSSFVEACRIRIPARASRPFNSRDLEVGNASKGCTGIGRGSGDWTLEFESDVPSVQLFSYARALDGSGFVNSLAGTAKEEQNEEGYWYYLPLVNPGNNQATRSTVRITNLGPNWASDVQLIGFDWDGVRYPRSGTTYLARTVLPNTTVSFTSQDLEVGNSAKLRGSSFGDGEGKWILWILSPHAPLEVTSLLTSRGLTSNISR